MTVLPVGLRRAAGVRFVLPLTAAAAALSAGFLATRSLRLGLAMVAVPVLVLLVTRLRANTLLLVAALPFPISLTRGAGGFEAAASDLLLAVALGGLLLLLVLDGKARERAAAVRPILLPVLVYALALIVVLAFHPGLRSGVKSVQQLELTALPAVLAAVVYQPKLMSWMLKAYVLAATVLAVAFALKVGSGAEGALQVGKNPGGQHIASAVLLLLAAPDFDKRWRPLLVPLSLGLLATQSRGALIALAASLIVLLVLKGQGSRVRLLLGAAAVIGLLTVAYQALPATAQKRILNTNQQTDYALRIRQAYRDDANALIADHPYVGIGVGNYLAGKPAEGTQTTDPHNVGLLVLAEGGIVLAAGFVILQLGSAAVLVRLRTVTPYAAVALAVQVGTVTHGFADTYWVRGTPDLGWFLLGAALVTRQARRDPTPA